MGWSGRGEGGFERRGRDGPTTVRRPYRLTHRERVKLCLESNNHIRDAFAAAQVQVFLSHLLIFILNFLYLIVTSGASSPAVVL